MFFRSGDEIQVDTLTSNMNPTRIPYHRYIPDPNTKTQRTVYLLFLIGNDAIQAHICVNQTATLEQEERLK